MKDLLQQDVDVLRREVMNFACQATFAELLCLHEVIKAWTEEEKE